MIEAGGIGYQAFISLNTYSKVPDKGTFHLHTYQHFTEAGQSLYGFADELEKQLFLLLISVSGVGPSIARMALSSLSPAEIQKAIAQGNVPLVQKIKGIGPKSAQRIILELKDKVLKTFDTELISAHQGNTVRDEALSALVALGFNKAAAEKVVSRVLDTSEDAGTVEVLIKKALKLL